jgi:hypothetical protein
MRQPQLRRRVGYSAIILLAVAMAGECLAFCSGLLAGDAGDSSRAIYPNSKLRSAMIYRPPGCTEDQRLATRPKHFLIASASLVRPTGTARRSAHLERQVEGVDPRTSVYKAGLRPNGWFPRLFSVLMQPGFWWAANLRRLLTSSRQISSRRASWRLPSSEPACPRQPSSGLVFQRHRVSRQLFREQPLRQASSMQASSRRGLSRQPSPEQDPPEGVEGDVGLFACSGLLWAPLPVQLTTQAAVTFLGFESAGLHVAPGTNADTMSPCQTVFASVQKATAGRSTSLDQSDEQFVSVVRFRSVLNGSCFLGSRFEGEEALYSADV